MKKALKIILITAVMAITIFSLAACEPEEERIVTDGGADICACEI